MDRSERHYRNDCAILKPPAVEWFSLASQKLLP